MGFWDEEKVIGELKKNKKEKFEIRETVLKGKEYRDVRAYYKDGDSGDFKPGKGISIPKEKAGIIGALILRDFDDEEIAELLERARDKDCFIEE